MTIEMFRIAADVITWLAFVGFTGWLLWLNTRPRHTGRPPAADKALAEMRAATNEIRALRAELADTRQHADR